MSVFRLSAIALSASLLSPLLSGRVGAQTLGLVELQLGESKDRVMSRLGRYYSIDSSMKVAGVWMVEARDGARVGTLAFRNGQLSVVGKTWEPADATPAGFAMAVIDAASRLQAEDGCRVKRDGISFEKGGGQDAIEIACGVHLVRISVTTSNGRRLVQVVESWHAD